MFYNYGGCAVFIKEPTYTSIEGYIFTLNDGVVTLRRYTGTDNNPVIPTPAF